MDVSEKPSVYIILVNWNGWQDTLECLRSLEQLQYSNYTVIVVDNGSTDQSTQKIRQRFPNIVLIESDKNLGFAGGNNLGIEYALDQQADYCWLLNNDTTVEPDALDHLINSMEADPEIGICGSKLVFYHQRDRLQALGGGYFNKWFGTVHTIGSQKPIDTTLDTNKIEARLDYIIGASMMVSRQFIEEVGLMNEEYFLYYEEIDWAMRAQEKFKLGLASQSIVYHKEGASTGGQKAQKFTRSKQSDYYQLKNRLKFTYNFYPLYLPFVYVSIFYALINRLRRGQWDRIPMIIKLMVTFNSRS